MIFTIGHQGNYDKALREHAALGQVTYKTGQGDGYPGGYAFQTAADAERRIAEVYPDHGFAVYEVDADWERDTHPSAEGWWHPSQRGSTDHWPPRPGPGQPTHRVGIGGNFPAQTPKTY